MDTKRSPIEVLRQRIVDAAREAAALLAAGDREAEALVCVERSRSLAAELKALSLRMGSVEGYDDAVRMLATIDEFQDKLSPSGGKAP